MARYFFFVKALFGLKVTIEFTKWLKEVYWDNWVMSLNGNPVQEQYILLVSGFNSFSKNIKIISLPDPTAFDQSATHKRTGSRSWGNREETAVFKSRDQ